MTVRAEVSSSATQHYQIKKQKNSTALHVTISI